MFKVKWTTAQSSLGHFALSLLVSIIMSVLAACAQYLYSGQFDAKALGVIAAAAFIASFSRGIISLENNPNLLPSLLDGINELKDLVAQSPSPSAAQPQGPLVVVHTTQAPQETPPPSVRAQNAIPPRPLVQPPVQLPQAVPVVQDVAKLSTIQVQAVPQVVFPERSFSGVIPVVNPGQ